MAKLIILRGDAPDRRVDLGERTMRIGRANQNDIVLPDPAKAVSRVHAELRFEQGSYVIVDLNSQNGVWADGRRVPQATLEPGVPVVLGSYRLVLERELPPAPASIDATLVVSPDRPDPLTAATMVAPLPEQPQPAVAKPPALAKPAAAPAAPAKPLAIAAAAPTPAAKPAPQARPAVRRTSKGVLAAGFVVVLVAALAATVFLTPLGSRLAEWTGRTPAGQSPGAAAPTDTQPAAAAAEPPTAPPPPEQAVAVPVEPPPAAMPAAAQVPAQRPAATPPPTARAPAKTPPALGRAPAATAGGRRGGTTGEAAIAAEPKPKPPNLAQKLEEARAAMYKGDYPAAIAGFEAILAVDPKYPNAADLLGVARGGARNESQLAVDAGSKAEAGGDYAGAARRYERALQLDPESTAAPEAMRRLKARMQSEGEGAFKRARQYDALGRVGEAISMYERAIQLLPPDHANATLARERLAALKGGV